MLGAHSNSELRGDYAKARADYTVDQDLSAYSATDRAVWRQLVSRQTAIIRTHACAEFVRGIDLLGAPDEIPDLERVGDFIAARTGWRLVPVPGFIPDEAFFTHLAARRFPVSVWVRRPDEIDFLVEPDLFHDFFGHVPMLLHPVFADYLAAYGAKGAEAAANHALQRLARLYWYMVEFGLIATADGLRAYGAGMLSSKTETLHSLESERPLRVWFDLERVMRTTYMIDSFQKTYFVLPDFDTLFDAMAQDFRPLYERMATLADIDAATLAPGDRIYRPDAEGASGWHSGRASAKASSVAQASSMRRSRG
ncbi:MAG: phenylalanine 4-monooxygenase [Rhodocyclales bacterium GWA2_65_20]|nr:MAG: phenylalanine 4-monooxygenase [Rhodocyclales bacterium GWA2_65_20]